MFLSISPDVLELKNAIHIALKNSIKTLSRMQKFDFFFNFCKDLQGHFFQEQ